MESVPTGLTEVEPDCRGAVAVAGGIGAFEQLAGDLLAFVSLIEDQDLFVSLGSAGLLAHGDFWISVELSIRNLASAGILVGRYGPPLRDDLAAHDDVGS